MAELIFSGPKPSSNLDHLLDAAERGQLNDTALLALGQRTVKSPDNILLGGPLVASAEHFDEQAMQHPLSATPNRPRPRL